jgi:thiamine-phosphate pyrophosphorylase
MVLPKLYAIADVGVLAARGVGLREFAEGLRAAGVSLVQLRDKDGSPERVLAGAAVLREVLPDRLLMMNDRADLAVLARFDGVHVGQGDLSVGDAKTVVCFRERYPRRIPQCETIRFPELFYPTLPGDEAAGRGWGTQGGGIVGLSTHSVEQVVGGGEADYLAVGPVFATGTKLDAEAVVGLEGVRRARALTGKPLVAIGGITRENCRSVVEAGADSVAVISGLLVAGEPVEKVARDFLAILG